jgi:hypothetical protein
MAGELALVREAGVRCHLCQGQVGPRLQEVLGPLDAARDDVPMRRQPGGRLELPREVVDAEVRGRGQLPQAQAGVEVLLDVLNDRAKPPSRERPSRPTSRQAGGEALRTGGRQEDKRSRAEGDERIVGHRAANLFPRCVG